MSSNYLVVERFSAGISPAPYERANVGIHVGDDQANVIANRVAVSQRAGFEFSDVIIMAPAHGTQVVRISRAQDIPLTPAGRVAPAADALVTTAPDVALMVMGADCAPVSIHGVTSQGQPCVAVVHVGWKGLAANVMANALNHFDLANVQVRVHPCICGQHYPVPDDRASQVPPASHVRCADGRTGIDLRRGIAQQCAELGISNVSFDPRCTYESADLFSYRRDAVTGRFAVMAWL